MQYRTGTVNVTNGSAVVTGNGTTWSTEVAANDYFIVLSVAGPYVIASVDSDTQITLTTNYAGTTATNSQYAIARDFTANFSWPLIYKGDIETAALVRQALTDMDSQMSSYVTSADVLEAQHWANYAEDSLVPEGDLVDDYSALHHAAKAADSEAAALLSEIDAEAAATAASTSETNAAASASAASTSETNAANSASAASTSETNAAASAASAAASYDAFDDRYLGDKASDPTLDNDGNALLTGALYFNTTADEMRVYDGAAWKTTTDSYTKTESDAKYAITSSVNTFTAGQVLSLSGPYIDLLDSGSTDKNYRIKDVGGTFYLTKINDARGEIGNVLTITDTASPLALTSSDITFGGQSLARVGTSNTFTQPQTLAKGSGFGWVLDATSAGTHRVFSATRSGTMKWELRVGSSEELQVVNAASGLMLYCEQGAKTLATNSTNYSYDNEGQMTYSGRLQPDGTAQRVPSGWSSTKLGTGHYRITHSLGNTGYAPVVTPYATAGGAGCRITNIQNTYFEFKILDASGTEMDSYSTFILMDYA